MSKPRLALLAIPLIVIAALATLAIKAGPAGIFPGDFPPVEDVTIGRVDLEPGLMTVVVTNGGPSEVDVVQVLVDEAYWDFTATPDGPMQRLASKTFRIPYPWVEGEPVVITLISSSGTTFEHEIAVAAESPPVSSKFILTFGLLGIYIGLIPVLLGMTFMPFLRTLSRRWLHFFMAFAAGVLIFLGVETLVEAIEQAETLPPAFGGIGVVSLGAIGSFALILAFSRMMQRRSGADSRLVVAFTVAAGIGLHNLGEGLAVGAAYRLGEIALGTFLVIGFGLHNTTEGLGIVSILGDRKVPIARLVGLGLIAGMPTVVGAWAGAFFFSPVLAAAFLAVATGAIAEVIVDVMAVVKREAQGGLASVESLGGIAAGLAVMYATGVFVAA